MSLVLFRRPSRRPGPEAPSGSLELQEPPALPERQSSISALFTYLPMAIASTGMVLIFLRPGGSGVFTYLVGGMMLVSTLAMLIGQLVRTAEERKQRLSGDRRDYLRYLSQHRRRVREAVVRQRDAHAWRNPDPAALWSLVRTSRLWERRTTHDDFAEVRLAVGDQRLALRVAPLQTKPVEDLEPLSAHALRRFVRAYTSVADQPIAVHLRGYARLRLGRSGPARPDEPEDPGTAEARAMVRALLAQLVVLHAPEELRVAVLAAPRTLPAWDWVKWLPHALHPSETDGAGPRRMVTDTPRELAELLGDEFAARACFDPQATPGKDEPFTVVVLDGVETTTDDRLGGGGYRNCVVLDITGCLPLDDSPHTLELAVHNGTVEVVGTDRNGRETRSRLGAADALSPVRALALARMLAPYRMSVTTEIAEPLETDFQLTTLLGISDLHTHELHRLREGRGPGERDRLRVPVGIAADGSPVELDLKESAYSGMGPHGMLIGATGSGKSELLRTLVTALALTHSSEMLNFVLVDFKGGATFLGLDDLPHTSAVITNLADEAALVTRMHDAVHGELIRRQELLRAAGNYTSALDYERARLAGAALAPLPSLVVIVDEFSELLAAHPGFMDLFIMIGRLGRSLGVHLLLASQRLDEGRVHQLESHLSYRVGLRTFSAMESRGVLGVPDAHQLPPAPGNGYLRSDTATLTRFKAAYVSGAYRAQRRARPAAGPGTGAVVPYHAGYVAPPGPLRPPEPDPQEQDETEPDSLLETARTRIRAAGGAPAHRIWLPPLDTPPALDTLLPHAADPAAAYRRAADRTGELHVPVGIIDRPFEQRRDPLTAELAGSGGHIGIAGGPQSGKSTLMATLITALAVGHTPREVQFHCLDFGGGTLGRLSRLPHVGTVSGRLQTERVTRTVAEVTTLLTRREESFAAHGVDSMADYRRRRAAGEFTDDPYGDLFLVVDGWSTMRQDFFDLAETLVHTATRGLNYGIHLVIASTRWAEIQPALRDQLGTRFELRLGDPVDSVVDMRTAKEVPRAPGRGLTEDGFHFLTALPLLADEGTAAAPLAERTQELTARIRDAWGARPGAPAVRMLPATVPAAELPAPRGRSIPLGLEETRVEPFHHDFDTSPHLLAVGDTESGKTNLLRLVTDAVVRTHGSDAAQFAFVDPRRELYDAVPADYRLDYAVSPDAAAEMVTNAVTALKPRLPGPDISPDRLRRHDWWTGPQLFLLVDDYDLIGGSGFGARSPLEPLLDLLGQGAEIGFHLVLARAAGGIGRAMSDPVLRRLGEAGATRLLLSCPPGEGMLFGDIKPRTLPPGRGLWLSRRHRFQVQTALRTPSAPQGEAEPGSDDSPDGPDGPNSPVPFAPAPDASSDASSGGSAPDGSSPGPDAGGSPGGPAADDSSGGSASDGPAGGSASGAHTGASRTGTPEVGSPGPRVPGPPAPVRTGSSGAPAPEPEADRPERDAADADEEEEEEA
ncbi:type VII secretion protein EccCa [Streptomyces cacaoi]|uniref:Type VII secretion protein EccC n=2 Tax=Streptomyces cacaoi TaxID=1898 RepID=A0A4Y3QX54_STRCI|nr:type VII secretion protein EccCa [Streptomyces cacaoi]GEB49173.1 type VII secretion protein EccC [Streptomyces cacaoi]